MLFWITVLVNLTLVNADPPMGWLQDSHYFETKAACEEKIYEHTPNIYASIHNWTAGLGSIEKIECMTEEDWIKKNSELGHSVPDDMKTPGGLYQEG